MIREDGLVLTIGYLITEASQIWLTTNRGDVVAAAAEHADGLADIRQDRLDHRAAARGTIPPGVTASDGVYSP